MKIQYIAVIFCIIVIPISIAASFYIESQIDTIKIQTSYNNKLNNATYDAVKAFQINTVNNNYSTISNSKIRDIEASINTFYNALSNDEYLSKEELQTFVPALVYTLYDGYYIYSKYDNVYPKANGEVLTENTASDNYGLKPYIYYSCRYKDSNRNFVVCYTLDNFITIYGIIGGEYQTLSGYLIDPTMVNTGSLSIDSTTKAIISEPKKWKITYGTDSSTKITIEPEILTEHLVFAESGVGSGDYEYLVYEGKKIYYDKDASISGGLTKYFKYENYDRNYIINSTSNSETIKYLEDRTYDGHLHSTTAIEYYYNAKVFSEKVKKLTAGIKQSNAIDEDGKSIQFSTNLNSDILVPSSSNDPLVESSNFNEQRKNVIRRTIETNLAAAIANYNEYSSNSYEYRMPVLQETDWEKITNNISVISFLQGIPIGHKYYNNYCVITNNNNKETVKKENIYIITENSSTGEREYHTPGCKELMQNSNLKIIEAYSNISFLRQNVRISEGNYKYFYPQAREDEFITSCYHCIVGANSLYDINQIINGKIQDEVTGTTINVATNTRFKDIRKLYLTALARERLALTGNSSEAVNFAVDTSPEAITGVKLNVTKTSNREGEKLNTGDVIKYTITVENVGNQVAKNVKIEDKISKYTIYSKGDTFNRYIGDLHPGDKAEVSFEVTVGEIIVDETVISNKAVVYYDGGSKESNSVILKVSKTDKLSVEIKCNPTIVTLGRKNYIYN